MALLSASAKRQQGYFGLGITLDYNAGDVSGLWTALLPGVLLASVCDSTPVQPASIRMSEATVPASVGRMPVSRTDVYLELRDADEPLTRHELKDRTGLSYSCVYHSISDLEDAGLVESQPWFGKDGDRYSLDI